ncbi:hypothetical protein B0H14DRAFT_3854488 [Mycena olivaceomarginata]|nr:hypothetical protein B0H14DRAFT_3854488 [Mycena olivaceomarginata]
MLPLNRPTSFTHICTIPMASSCKSYPQARMNSCKVLDDSVNTFNSGLFIEGLAIQRPSLVITLNVLNDLITNVLSNPSWQTTGGIITNGGSRKNGDSILVRALTAAYVRNVTTPDIRKTLRDYISVQFNAVIDLATNGDNIYGAQWIGPATRFPPCSNTAYFIASDMNITASSTSTSSTSQEQSPTPSSTPSKAPGAGNDRRSRDWRSASSSQSELSSVSLFVVAAHEQENS